MTMRSYIRGQAKDEKGESQDLAGACRTFCAKPMRRGRPGPIPADPAPAEVILLAFRSLLGAFLCHRFGRLLLCFFPLVFALAHEMSSSVVILPLPLVLNSRHGSRTCGRWKGGRLLSSRVWRFGATWVVPPARYFF